MIGFDHAALFHLDTAGGRLRGALSFCAAAHDDLEAQAADALSAQERALFTDRLAPRRRHALLLGRRTAKQALRLLNPALNDRDLSILPGVLGQPVVRGPRVENLQVSLSHTGSLALAAAFPDDCPMGVDVDRVSPSHRAALSQQIAQCELQRLRAVKTGDDDAHLLALWCQKEALSKILRCGLTLPFHLLEVSEVRPDGPGFQVRFAHFSQYVGFGLSGARLALAVVLPRHVCWGLADGRAPLDLLSAWLADAERADGAL